MILIFALNAIRNKIFMMAHFWTSKKTIVDFGHGTLLDRCCRLHNVIWLGFGKVRKCHKDVFISNFINFYLNWTIVIWQKYSKLKKNNEFPAKSSSSKFRLILPIWSKLTCKGKYWFERRCYFLEVGILKNFKSFGLWVRVQNWTSCHVWSANFALPLKVGQRKVGHLTFLNAKHTQSQHDIPEVDKLSDRNIEISRSSFRRNRN